jgi:hypothetical protein
MEKQLDGVGKAFAIGPGLDRGVMEENGEAGIVKHHCQDYD